MVSKEMIIWFSDLACLVLFESLRWLRKTLIKGHLRVLLQLTIIHATLSKISITRKSYQKFFLFEFPANRIRVKIIHLMVEGSGKVAWLKSNLLEEKKVKGQTRVRTRDQ